jgi:hypothetical protein
MDWIEISVSGWLGLSGSGVLFGLISGGASWIAMIIRAYVGERKQVPKWLLSSTFTDFSSMDVSSRLAQLNYARSNDIFSIVWEYLHYAGHII